MTSIQAGSFYCVQKGGLSSKLRTRERETDLQMAAPTLSSTPSSTSTIDQSISTLKLYETDRETINNVADRTADPGDSDRSAPTSHGEDPSLRATDDADDDKRGKTIKPNIYKHPFLLQLFPYIPYLSRFRKSF